MIEQIKKLFPSTIISFTPHEDLQYSWYPYEDRYIGILKTELTVNESYLLNLLLQPNNGKSEPLNTALNAKKWYQYLFDGHPLFPGKEKKPYRLIQFSIASQYEVCEKEEWEEAMKSFFPHEVTMVRNSRHQGVLIEEKRSLIMSEKELHDAIATLESDFFFHVRFFVGQFYLKQDIKSIFKYEQQLFQFARKKLSKERLFNMENVIPPLAAIILDQDLRSSLFKHILNVFTKDPDLWKTIKQYIENHSNVSLTAKQLFMHRNSLQYRIDKFMNKTGVDLKSFQGAFTTYLACLDFEQQHM